MLDASTTQPECSPARNNFAEFLTRIETVVTVEWLPQCPDPLWARRVFRPLLDDFQDAREQLQLAAAAAKVRVAINHGAATINDVCNVTGLSVKEVRYQVEQLVISGEFRWVSSWESAVARGESRRILHRSGSPICI